MTNDEAAELCRRWQADGDEKARTRMVVEWTPLVHSVVRRYRLRGASEDAAQEGMFGLMRAIDLYDWNRAAFSTYASMWVRSHVTRFIEINSGIVRLPLSKVVRRLRIDIAGVIEEAGGEDATTDSIAEAVGADADLVNAAAVRRMYRNGGVMSLDSPVGGGRAQTPGELRTRHDVIPAPGEGAEDALDAARSARAIALSVHRALTRIPAREAEIIRRHLLAEDGETLKQIGESMGITRERVRQLEERGVGMLAAALRREIAA